MMTEKDNRRRNYLIVARLLGIGGICLMLFSRRLTAEPEKSILRNIAFLLLLALTVQTILFYIKPALFKDKPTHPD
jgi:hypothetical protein